MENPLIQKDPFEEGNFEAAPIDGVGNNLENPEYGAANTALLNIVPLDYSDGFSTAAGADRPNPRQISNEVSYQSEEIPEPRGLTNVIWGFGQFLDHDLSLTPELSAEQAAAEERFISVEVPPGDPQLDPQGTGEVVIEMRDFVLIEGTGTDPTNPLQLPNVITAWIDGSNIYGSDEERYHFLRSFESGKLKISEGNLLPFNDRTIENDNPTEQDPTTLFVAGDVRANENSALVSVHTLFVREHNRLAEELVAAHPDWSDEELFQRARQINVAQLQAIVYNEYLPALLGKNPLPEYRGYDPSINPGIDRTFSTAAFRLGHTQLSSEIPRLDPNGEEIPEGNLTLSELFFRSGALVQETGIDPILRGIAGSGSQKVDTRVIEDVRSLLFGFGANASARDLVAINIQRGRHNGLADYNTVRESFGLTPVTSFAEITSDSEIQAALETLYGSVDNIDPFIGILAEDLLPGASVGETVSVILRDQFGRLRDGDRFYYENTFSPPEIAELNNTRLSDIIRRNTDTEVIQENVFFLNSPPEAVDDSVTLRSGTTATIAVLDNDSDPDGDPIEVLAFTSAAQGTVSIEDNLLVYQPHPGFTGTDSFTYIIQDSFNNTGTATVSAIVNPGDRPNLDMDKNGSMDALTDGLLVMRYLFGFRGDDLIDGAIGQGALRKNADDMTAYLDGSRDSMLDVDGNGITDALTDGITIIRYLFGFTGDALIKDAIGRGATRSTATEIKAFLESFDLLPGSDLQGFPELNNDGQII
ncbi:MAG: peroxidase family protein [Hormoscilla sp.]